MSEALDYLAKVRPDAMGHYLKFLKESARHLDPKTRWLISVVTKVVTGSERGLKQYLPRAIEAGAAPNEILDAILCAFPAAGLTKVLSAVDVLLSMDLPEFRAENLDRPAGWHRIGPIAEFPDERPAWRTVEERTVIVVRRNGSALVFDDHCPHRKTKIPLQQNAAGNIVCPGHHWEFDPQSGACVKGGNRPMSRIPVKVEADTVFAEW